MSEAPQSPDLSALLKHAMAKTGATQADISRRTGIPPATLSAWLRRTRRATDSDLLRALAEKSGLGLTVREVHEAAERPMPNPVGEEKAKQLLRLFGELTEAEQRVVEATAEAIRMNRAS
ncbi:helix-turn-helix domain-containing protein [Embleya sp. NPDC056575]|uniref:helix-turn-helix domain-containing protein n=1 Tax=unclassified Embleya TaxID=2699296 RepID=UPI0036866572